MMCANPPSAECHKELATVKASTHQTPSITRNLTDGRSRQKIGWRFICSDVSQAPEGGSVFYDSNLTPRRLGSALEPRFRFFPLFLGSQENVGVQDFCIDQRRKERNARREQKKETQRMTLV